MPRTRPLPVAVVVLAGLLAAGCGRLAVPVQVAVEPAAERVPVVLVPGITGTALRDPATGRLAWGDGAAILRPRDRGYALARPIRPGTIRPGGPLEVAGVIDEVRLGPIRKPIYGPIVELLERHGYRAGDLASPRPGDDLYLFAYDWRLENAVSAAALAERLEGVRRARGEASLRVDLVCQSNGAQICRWFAKYGGATLEEAATPGAPGGRRVRVRKLVLVSASNGGSLEALRWLERGRRYLPLVGRYWSPEVLFTLRSIYDGLPVDRSDLFLDAAGEPLAVDLFDAGSWRRYQWSVFSPAVARRIERRRRADLFGSAAEREVFLQQELDRARRFHELLQRDLAGFDGVRYYLIQNLAAETPRRVVLTRRSGGWRTRFPGDRWLERRPELRRRTVTAGDGHATAESQLWLAPQERLALGGRTARVDGAHFELILAPEAQLRLVAFLGEPVDSPPPGRR